MYTFSVAANLVDMAHDRDAYLVQASLRQGRWLAIRIAEGVVQFSERRTVTYQPTRASAAAWRRFILLFLEARIVAGNALRGCPNQFLVLFLVLKLG
jgi:hypothetical protein